eukprot:TRINITY_DN1292_c0_g1_i1.p1 TRINITY_DN1292_c0_g1~~TRINITY_DN1292_c0_g1_i1.p1  ORF type:complete len:362 (+),score=77.66 TRINITY_DN1292_c0_g1_i1:170-1255(+)
MRIHHLRNHCCCLIPRTLLKVTFAFWFFLFGVYFLIARSTMSAASGTTMGYYIGLLPKQSTVLPYHSLISSAFQYTAEDVTLFDLSRTNSTTDFYPYSYDSTLSVNSEFVFPKEHPLLNKSLTMMFGYVQMSYDFEVDVTRPNSTDVAILSSSIPFAGEASVKLNRTISSSKLPGQSFLNVVVLPEAVNLMSHLESNSSKPSIKKSFTAPPAIKEDLKFKLSNGHIKNVNIDSTYIVNTTEVKGKGIVTKGKGRHLVAKNNLDSPQVLNIAFKSTNYGFMVGVLTFYALMIWLVSMCCCCSCISDCVERSQEINDIRQVKHREEEKRRNEDVLPGTISYMTNQMNEPLVTSNARNVHDTYV